MIITLNHDGTLTIAPQTIPEVYTNIFISYKMPKGLNHLMPVLYWGDEMFSGNNIRISKKINTENFFKEAFRVCLYDGYTEFRTYTMKKDINPLVYVGYNVQYINSDITKYIETLEQRVRELEEQGDIV